ncbi:hypothetical protein LTR37_001559 [Vermiconidia calcicola]|uniref:Uncharacterized protein n=1 Tax=Vermiconidia calcicola TaxID=1690605 RepID=A0ACC3NVI1_9PEZI|nr:hypothetical protein LTR37_001559 [Vermiconidia calcicola]
MFPKSQYARGGIDLWSKVDGNKTSGLHSMMPESNAPMLPTGSSYNSWGNIYPHIYNFFKQATPMFSSGSSYTRSSNIYPTEAGFIKRTTTYAAKSQAPLASFTHSSPPLRPAQAWADHQSGGINANTSTASFGQEATHEEDIYGSGYEHGNDDEHGSDHEDDDDAYGSDDSYCSDEDSEDDIVPRPHRPSGLGSAEGGDDE